MGSRPVVLILKIEMFNLQHDQTESSENIGSRIVLVLEQFKICKTLKQEDKIRFITFEGHF